MKRLILIVFSVLLVCACPGRGQDETPFWHTTPADSLLAERILTQLKEYPDESVPVLMARAAQALEGQPYVAGTLEERPREELCIYLTRTDCILFVETCLALARTARQDGGFRQFAEELRQSRYRDGRITAYADRLHYTLDWERQGIRRGTLEDLTPSLGGLAYPHPVHYMSDHPDAYPRLDDLPAIRAAEERINAEPFRYIPKNQVEAVIGSIRTGDILCFVSAIEGLDILHVATAVVDADGAVRFRHASTGAMKVVLEPRTLQQYLAGRRNLAGIQVLRPLDCKSGG